jgi:hypothetical protein
MGRTAWLDPAELLLTDLGDLRACAPLGRHVQSGYTGLAMGPFSSNIYLAIDGFEPSV